MQYGFIDINCATPILPERRLKTDICYTLAKFVQVKPPARHDCGGSPVTEASVNHSHSTTAWCYKCIIPQGVFEYVLRLITALQCEP